MPVEEPSIFAEKIDTRIYRKSHSDWIRRYQVGGKS
jgi:hypothetical protein